MLIFELIFEFDKRKAASNLRTHGVSFAEASSVFADPLSSTLPDDQHSEMRSVSSWWGCRIGVASCSSFTLSVAPASDSSVHASQPRLSRDNMPKASKRDSLAERVALDFSRGLRGKHVKKFQQGTNLVLIEPDVMSHFGDADSVNRALRMYLELAQEVQSVASGHR